MPRFTHYEFQGGSRGKSYGIWDHRTKAFVYDIAEASPMLAEARLHYYLNKAGYQKRYTLRELPEKIAADFKTRPPKEPKELYGIWNDVKKEFQFGIAEASPELAFARLFYKIGDNARKWRFSAMKIPKDIIPAVKARHHKK